MDGLHDGVRVDGFAVGVAVGLYVGALEVGFPVGTRAPIHL